MFIVTITDLRNHAKSYFDRVQNGESFEIHRRGRAVAVLSPARHRAGAGWKTATPLKVPGLSLSRMIVEDRRGRR